MFFFPAEADTKTMGAYSRNFSARRASSLQLTVSGRFAVSQSRPNRSHCYDDNELIFRFHARSRRCRVQLVSPPRLNSPAREVGGLPVFASPLPLIFFRPRWVLPLRRNPGGINENGTCRLSGSIRPPHRVVVSGDGRTMARELPVSMFSCVDFPTFDAR